MKICDKVTEQCEGGNEVVFWLAIKNAALIQWHKLKKETPGTAYIDMLNGIIPGQASNISQESDQIEGRLSNRCSDASITNQTLNRNCKIGKEHEEKLCSLAILKSEVILVEKWKADLRSIQSNLEKAKEICNWRAKYQNLEEEKERLVEEILSEIEKDYAREKERKRELNNENQQTH